MKQKGPCSACRFARRATIRDVHTGELVTGIIGCRPRDPRKQWTLAMEWQRKRMNDQGVVDEEKAVNCRFFEAPNGD